MSKKLFPDFILLFVLGAIISGCSIGSSKNPPNPIGTPSAGLNRATSTGQNVKIPDETKTATTTTTATITTTNRNQVNIPPASTSNSEIITDKRVAIEDVKKNDKIASMFIAAISPYKSYKPIDAENYIVEFKGEVEISGTYTYYDDEYDPLKNEVCFNDLAEASKEKMPQFKGDDKDIWFCFENKEFARDGFKPKGSSGLATVVINKYTILNYGTEVWNTAKLIKILTK